MVQTPDISKKEAVVPLAHGVPPEGLTGLASTWTGGVVVIGVEVTGVDVAVEGATVGGGAAVVPEAVLALLEPVDAPELTAFEIAVALSALPPRAAPCATASSADFAPVLALAAATFGSAPVARACVTASVTFTSITA